MTKKEEFTKPNRKPAISDGLEIPPAGSIRVSSKPLEEGMREKYKIFAERVYPKLMQMESTAGAQTILALRCGRRFLCTSDSGKGGDHEAGMAIEIVDYDPTTRRILSIGKAAVPTETPLIWWGFNLYKKTNYALLTLERGDKKENKGGRIEGIWHLDEEGSRLAVIRVIKKLHFPVKVMMDIFTDCKEQQNPSDMARNEIDFFDGKLILGETIESLFA